VAGSGLHSTIRQTTEEDVLSSREEASQAVHQDRQGEMRRDKVELVRKAVAENRRAYVLVNNRSEGNAPLITPVLKDHSEMSPHD